MVWEKERVAPGTELTQGKLCDESAQKLETTTATAGRVVIVWWISPAAATAAAAAMAQMTVRGGIE